MKRKTFFYVSSCITTLLICCLFMTSCNDNDCNLETMNEQTAGIQKNLLEVNGNSETYALTNDESKTWSIRETPAWVTPITKNGTSSDSIRLYVESNSRSPREGTIVISYADGRKRSVTVRQSTEQTFSIQRTYAIGWSFDVRTYMDFRGLKEQVFNTQKLKTFDPECYRIEKSASSHIDYYYGESGSQLSDNMSAKLGIDGKFNAFSLDVQASFGKTALNDSKRIFSKIRNVYQERIAYFNQLDMLDVQEEDLFTADFAAERQQVIESGGSDEAIKSLIDHYGTHVVIQASLGGFYDYYFSSVVEKMEDDMNVQAAINVGFADKFGLEADANYRDDFNSLNDERIEQFSVKGGDAVTLATAVAAGTIDQEATDQWLQSLTNEEKYELLSFMLVPISDLFPDDIKTKIDHYTDLMYYYDIPVTRMQK